MIIEIDIWKKSFWIAIVIIGLVINWLCLIALGLARARKTEVYDLGDALNGVVLLIVTIGWWLSE